ncbi:MAG: transposase [Ruminococcus sp.]
MNTEHPTRKKNRLENYDYASCGAYFVTICIAQSDISLWQNVGANFVRPKLSNIRKVVSQEIKKLGTVYPNVTINKYCIMPDHIHMILLILPDENGRTQFAPTLSRVVKQFKGAITKQIGFSIWQKSFYDRILRNEKEYRNAWQYIQENPIKWIAQHCDDTSIT